MELGDRRQKFIMLAEKRVTRAIKDLRLIGNLSNKSNYSYDQEDVSQILSALHKELSRLKKRFDSIATEDLSTFKLGKHGSKDLGDE
ncbi:MAG: hypothetical protein WCP72_09590 [Desulfomonile sp.]